MKTLRTILNELNNETKFIDDNELAAHETAIKSAIATHDTDIKEQLALIKNSLAEQKAQLDEIIRLLKTHQGKRPNWNK